MAETILLLAAWGLWCSLHSWLARPLVRERLEKRFPALGWRYRLLYNLLATVSLLPLAWWQLHRPAGEPVLVWTGSWKLLQAGYWLAAFLLFWGGARVYPLREFCGLPPQRGAGSGPPPLVTSGTLGVVRHPWYLAGLLVLWARDLDPQNLLVALLLSLYLVFGACLEERRLLRVYGVAYRTYRRQVAAWLPGKSWLRRWGQRFRDRFRS